MESTIFSEDTFMRKRWRTPPDICRQHHRFNANADPKANCQIANCQIKSNKIKLNKRPISNGIRAKVKLPNLPKRNRAFYLLGNCVAISAVGNRNAQARFVLWFITGARPPPFHRQPPKTMLIRFSEIAHRTHTHT